MKHFFLIMLHNKHSLKNLLNDFSQIEIRDIVGRVIANFYQADEELGNALAEGSNVVVQK